MMLKINTAGDVTEVMFDNVPKLNILISETVKADLQKLFEQPNTKVLINMDGVRFIDSSGFAVFLSVSKIAGKTGGQIIFCNVCDSAMNLFKVLQLHTVFRIVNDRDDAINAFQ
jgi:anti-anti-sigma factor